MILGLREMVPLETEPTGYRNSALGLRELMPLENEPTGCRNSAAVAIRRFDDSSSDWDGGETSGTT